MNITFGSVIRHWRNIRRFSQLALSAESGISSRHISFLETGRSKPSRGSVLTLARVLDMPKPAVNDALLAAGYAPEYPVLDVGDDEIAPLMEAVMTILKNHEPMPSIAVDAGWNIVGGNATAQKMMQHLPFKGSLNIVDAMLNDNPDEPVFINWREIAAWTLTRFQIELARMGGEGPLLDVYKRLANDPRAKGLDAQSFAGRGPILTLNMRIEGHDLSLFTMLADFTTAQDVAMSERRVELFFPADAKTKAYFDKVE